MSKLSPYRKPPPRREVSPPPQPATVARLVDKSRPGRSFIPSDPQYDLRITDKKRHDNPELDSLHERNNHLSAENSELYLMLEERGRIITALEQKLEEQIQREVSTLEQIEFEKNIFIGEFKKKANDYEHRIEALTRELNQLAGPNPNKFNTNLHSHLNELERARTKQIIDIKNQQLAEISAEYRGQVEQLKTEVNNLSNQIMHANHIKKIELSELQLHYQNVCEELRRDLDKEREILLMQTDSELKKMSNLLNSKQVEAERLDGLIKNKSSEDNIRQQEFYEQKVKLEIEIGNVSELHKKISFSESQRLKELNNFELEAARINHDANVNNLKSENSKLMELNTAKTNGMDDLYRQIAEMRSQQAVEVEGLEQLVESLRVRMQQRENEYLLEEEMLKIKMAELREADLTALREFYEHEMSLLTEELNETRLQSQDNRSKLRQELEDKSELRQYFDLESGKLKSKICELELRLATAEADRKEDSGKAQSQMEMTSMLLLREAKEKQKYSQFGEEEKKKLQMLIQAKDKQIQELCNKIALLRENNAREIGDKNSELEMVRKAKEDIENELRKEKLFYDAEIKRKDFTIKNAKETYNEDIVKIKRQTVDVYDRDVNELRKAKAALEAEVNRYKQIEKQLKESVEILEEHKHAENLTQNEDMQEERVRLTRERNESEGRISEHYQQEIAKLRTQIADLRRQLSYREEDLRALTEKYRKLEVKFAQVIESQEKLRSLETKVMAMGQESNLAKNLADFVKSRKK